MRTTKLMAVVGLAMALGFSTTQAQSGAQGHIVMPAAEMKWGPAPPGLPPGAQLAVLSGDPGKAAPFVISAKFADGYTVRPHWHPTDENVVVVSGTLMAGVGDKYDEASMKVLDQGSYVSMPQKMTHFVKAKGATQIVISGMGPFEITYVDPKDDPRKK
jgi:quercetin dioxygenase-like cupin family protein